MKKRKMQQLIIQSIDYLLIHKDITLFCHLGQRLNVFILIARVKKFNI